MGRKRIDWIDYLGGGAMLLVFIQHSMVPIITRIILAFHMPLFFWISGFLYEEKNEEKTTVKKFILKRFYRLVMPWFMWVGVDYIITLIVGIISGDFDLFHFLRTLEYDLLYCTSFWFLPCLFVAESFFHVMQKRIYLLGERKILMLFMAVVFWGISYIENQSAVGKLPFKLDVSIMALGFLFLGAGTHDLVIKMKNQGLFPKIFEIIGFFAIALVCVILNGKTGNNFMMYINEYGNYFWAVSGASLLIVFMILALDVMPVLPKRYLQFLRDNSLILFPVHLIIIRFINLVYDFDGINLWLYAMTCLGCIHILIVPICRSINKYIPLLAGRP